VNAAGALCQCSFNTELVELDNPGMGKADLSAFESGSQAPGTTMLILFLTTS
jgi:outer membrane usher protein